MAQPIVILKRAQQKVEQVYSYLIENWNEKVAEDFYKKFENTVKSISVNPYSGRVSVKKKDVRRKLITKHNCLYYRIKEDSVIVISVMDTRINPKRNSFD